MHTHKNGHMQAHVHTQAGRKRHLLPSLPIVGGVRQLFPVPGNVTKEHHHSLSTEQRQFDITVDIFQNWSVSISEQFQIKLVTWLELFKKILKEASTLKSFEKKKNKLPWYIPKNLTLHVPTHLTWCVSTHLTLCSPHTRDIVLSPHTWHYVLPHTWHVLPQIYFSFFISCVPILITQLILLPQWPQQLFAVISSSI